AAKSEKEREIKHQTEMGNLPKQVAEYLRNTAPLQGLVSPAHISQPAPPRGLVAFVDGQVGTTASQLAHDVLDFLARRGEPPQRKPNEGDIDFLVRANAWYAGVMAKYNREFK